MTTTDIHVCASCGCDTFVEYGGWHTEGATIVFDDHVWRCENCGVVLTSTTTERRR